ncbi:pilus assembly protein TadG-related protein [Chloroflexota bacterium]
MKRLLNSHTRGQSLILMVILSVAIIGVLALALDMGYTYYIRRWAQNAADSGALAAARELCLDSDPATRFTKATNSAADYVENRNLAYGVNSQTMTNITFHPDAGLEEDEAQVEVAINHPNFVARFFGTDSTTVPAIAAAGCFAPGSAVGQGVLPIAWGCQKILGSGSDQSCDISFIPEAEVCELGVDTRYIFIQQPGADCTDPNKPAFICAGDPFPPGCDPLGVEELDCGAGDPDLGPDMVILADSADPQGWAWIDLDGVQLDATDLEDWVINGTDEEVNSHTWLFGMGSTTGKVYHAVYEYHLFDEVIIPIFDSECKTCDPEFPVTCGCTDICDWHADIPDEKKLNQASSCQTPYYHLRTFGLFKIMCVDKPGVKCTDNDPSSYLSARDALEELNPNLPGGVPWSKINSIEGCFKGGFHPGLHGKPGDGVDAGAWTLYLTR